MRQQYHEGMIMKQRTNPTPRTGWKKHTHTQTTTPKAKLSFLPPRLQIESLPETI